MKNLCYGCSDEQRKLLLKLLPCLRAIIETADIINSVINACYAIQHLLRSDDVDVVHALCFYDVTSVLVASITIGEARNTLNYFTECANEEQFLDLATIMAPKLYSIMAERKSNKHLCTAAECLDKLFRDGGEKVVKLVLKHTPLIVEELIGSVDVGSHQFNQVRVRSKACIKALMQGLRSASIGQLGRFNDVYEVTFTVMSVYRKASVLLLDILTTLIEVLPKLPHAAGVVALTSQENWKKVRNLEKAGNSNGTGEDQKAVALKASMLLQIARVLHLVDPTLLGGGGPDK